VRIVVLFLAAAAVATPTTVRAQHASFDGPASRVLNAGIDSVIVDTAGPVLTPLTERLWGRFDSVLVAQLNAGRDLGAINTFLSGLSHFAGAGGEPGVRIGGRTFYRELPRFAPTYYAAQLGSGDGRPVLGVFCYPSENGPSHMAVFSRRDGHFIVSDTLTSDEHIRVVGTHSDSGAPLLATFETHMMADGTQSSLRLWWVRDGRLVAEPFSGPPQLRDADFAPTDSSIEVRSAQYPSILDGCEMCIRLRRQVSFVVHGPQVFAHSTSLNPWVDVVERFVALAAQGKRDSAADFVTSREILDSLWSNSIRRVEGVSEHGSLEEGVSCVVLTAIYTRGRERERERNWRVFVAADSTRTWRIVGADSRGRPVIGRRLTSACS
jgi:hypothetical protein